MAKRDSYKPEIILRLFRKISRDSSGNLKSTVVSKDDVARELEIARAEKLLTERQGRNTANFFKDIIRHEDAERFWPKEVLEAGYTGRQSTGDSNIFEFVKVPKGQSLAFPNELVQSQNIRELELQTASVNLFARSLGISGESWIAQVLVQIKGVETHFSLVSPRRDRILQIDHLQIGKKGNLAEIDALYLATESGSKGEEYSLIIFEVKQQKERIILEQIAQQVREAIKLARRITATGRRVDYIVPCAISNLGNSRIHFREFAAFSRGEWDAPLVLETASEAVYKLMPPIVGI